jgi:hypothetical protein
MRALVRSTRRTDVGRDAARVTVAHAFGIVELTGFEPVTYWLQTNCSDQLSYSPDFSRLRGARLGSERLD